jgi:hypothetical protein
LSWLRKMGGALGQRVHFSCLSRLFVSSSFSSHLRRTPRPSRKLASHFTKHHTQRTRQTAPYSD